MRSYEKELWLTSADAQLTKMGAYARHLGEDLEWTWLMPEKSDGLSRANDLLENVSVLRVPWPRNVYQHRFHFDMSVAIHALQGIRPELIVCEVPEHVASWRVAQEIAGNPCPIIAMVEHVDIYDETSRPTSFFLRQVEGALLADLVAFPLEQMREQWLFNSRAVTSVPGIVDRTTIWRGLIDPQEIRELASSRVQYASAEGRKRIFFGSRLSDSPRTRYDVFFEAVNLLRVTDDFDVVVANPNEALAWPEVERLCPDVMPVLVRDRSDYAAQLLNADVVPILYDVSRIYSIGFAEAVAMGKLVVTAKPVRGTDSCGLWVDDPSDPEQVAEKLHDSLKGDPVAVLGEQDEWLDCVSVPNRADEIRADIDRIMT